MLMFVVEVVLCLIFWTRDESIICYMILLNNLFLFESSNLRVQINHAWSF